MLAGNDYASWGMEVLILMGIGADPIRDISGLQTELVNSAYPQVTNIAMETGPSIADLPAEM